MGISLGQFSTAIQSLKKALAIDPEYGLAYLTRGIVYETAAEQQVAKAGGKISFDDKLAYKIAYDDFARTK